MACFAALDDGKVHIFYVSSVIFVYEFFAHTWYVSARNNGNFLTYVCKDILISIFKNVEHFYQMTMFENA